MKYILLFQLFNKWLYIPAIDDSVFDSFVEKLCEPVLRWWCNPRSVRHWWFGTGRAYPNICIFKCGNGRNYVIIEMMQKSRYAQELMNMQRTPMLRAIFSFGQFMRLTNIPRIPQITESFERFVNELSVKL